EARRDPHLALEPQEGDRRAAGLHARVGREAGRAGARGRGALPGAAGLMKVVLFCGGQGLPVNQSSPSIPQPMVPLRDRPILWHIMKFYAHFGHTDFILCLGYHAKVIKKFFLEYNEAVSNDFVFSGGGKEIELLRSDIDDWRITFVDTGLNANVGQRLKAVEDLVGDDVFLATYGDGLTDVNLANLLDPPLRSRQ